MATSKKITELPTLTAATADDIFYVVNDPGGVPASLKITAKALFESNVVSNASFDGVVSGTVFKPNYTTTPASATAVPVGFGVGTMWADADYIYVVTGASALKRIAIATW